MANRKRIIVYVFPTRSAMLAWPGFYDVLFVNTVAKLGVLKKEKNYGNFRDQSQAYCFMPKFATLSFS